VRRAVLVKLPCKISPAPPQLSQRPNPKSTKPSSSPSAAAAGHAGPQEGTPTCRIWRHDLQCPPSTATQPRPLDRQSEKSARREIFYYDETDLMPCAWTLVRCTSCERE